MSAIIAIGPCPKNELQAKSRDARFQEAVIFRKQLERVFPFNGVPIWKAVGGWFRVKGSFEKIDYQVIFTYEPDDVRMAMYAFMLERNIPKEWDSESLTLLQEYYDGQGEGEPVRDYRERSRSRGRGVVEASSVEVAGG